MKLDAVAQAALEAFITKALAQLAADLVLTQTNSFEFGLPDARYIFNEDTKKVVAYVDEASGVTTAQVANALETYYETRR